MTQQLSNDQSSPSLLLVLGYLAIKDIANIEERVSVLARLGYKNPDIAVICDITPASVKTHKYEGKKKSTKKVEK